MDFFTLQKIIRFYLVYRGELNADPTLINSALELPTFGVMAKVNLTGVQWKNLALGEFGMKFSKCKFFLFWRELAEKIRAPSYRHFFDLCFFFTNYTSRHGTVFNFFQFYLKTIASGSDATS